MCQKEVWENAKKIGGAYYPPTFEKDGCCCCCCYNLFLFLRLLLLLLLGFYTHATAVPSRLIVTANHFYQGY